MSVSKKFLETGSDVPYVDEQQAGNVAMDDSGTLVLKAKAISYAKFAAYVVDDVFDCNNTNVYVVWILVPIC